METETLDPKLFLCPYCGEEERRGIHNHKEKLWKCHNCKRCFSVIKGTVFENLHYPIWGETLAVLIMIKPFFDTE